MQTLSIRNLKIIDSTTIRLFSDILRGVGRNTLDGSRKKGGIKVHTMMDAFSGVAEFVRMTEARVHDRKFLYHIELPANSFMVFDKAYNHYSQFDKWTKQKIWFVTRMKDNAVYHVNKVLVDNTQKKKAKGIVKEQLITVGYKNTAGNIIRVRLRRIIANADDAKQYVFLTNNLTLPAAQIALIYKT
ncbi:MAG: transposase [Chitinophagaceae bacterium]